MARGQNQQQQQRLNRTAIVTPTFHSFIHYGDLYSAPSRLLLRSAPDPCTAKEKSFEARVKCVRKNPGAQLVPRSMGTSLNDSLVYSGGTYGFNPQNK